MEAFLISAGVVALAEIGDKTQLFALVLAARFRRPLPIIAGILVATLVNHGAAGAIGTWLSSLLTPTVMRWALIVSFVSMAIWILVPDKYEESGQPPAPRSGVFLTTLVGFFLLEIGDKTQIATIALAAKYHALLAVVAGTTLGMMAVNIPAVLIGQVAANRLSLRLVRGFAALIFVALSVLMLFGIGI
ncbi:MAG TPA: TMEM165/GDT1 family protein [Steroidobacteraceae bacterium]